MKIGDKVRFLSETGGGKVAGFQGKDIVLVEDEDGFQIPTAVSDVVVVEDDDYSTRRLVENKMKKPEAVPSDDDDYDPADRPVTFKAPVEERKGGEQLNAFLAFVPMDAKAISSSRFEAYFVNDSNYYMFYTYYIAEGASWQLRSSGEVEPNTKLFVEEFGREDLGDLDRVCIQILSYKRGKPFLIKPAVDEDYLLPLVFLILLEGLSERLKLVVQYVGRRHSACGLKQFGGMKVNDNGGVLVLNTRRSRPVLRF